MYFAFWVQNTCQRRRLTRFNLEIANECYEQHLFATVADCVQRNGWFSAPHARFCCLYEHDMLTFSPSANIANERARVSESKSRYMGNMHFKINH